MKIKNRQQLLTMAAIAVIALFATDKLVISPLGNLWNQRAKRISELKKKVEDGVQLIKYEQSWRSRWEQMRKSTLPNNPSIAEQQVLGAFDRWSQNNHVSITSINPQWKRDADEYTTLQCRVEASGSLSALSHFLYDIEKDPTALKLEIVELSSRDTDGQQLALGLQISGLVLTPQERKP